MAEAKKSGGYRKILDIRQWLYKETGVQGLYLQLWSLLSVLFTLLVMILIPRAGILIAGLLHLGGHVALQLWTAKASTSKYRFSPKSFFTSKKLINYAAFVQFCYHSIALVLAWSASRIGDLPYYLLYAGNALIVLSYAPVYFTLNSKKNQVDRGIMEVVSKNGRKKYRPLNVYRGFFPGLLSWVDALVWASAVVIFINSLVFQLYQIPSESMVPELYVGSRVFTVKTFTNPEIPLSLVRIPVTAGINRFDQYVISNPRFNYKKEEVLKDFLHNFLYMISFTLIKNPKLDQYGEVIADPLIKRLIGLPGEQLMMVDDTVYVRSRDGGDFRKLAGDELHAYNFSTNVVADARRIERPVINPVVKKAVLDWDTQKNEAEALLSAKTQRWLSYFDQLPELWQRYEYDPARLPRAVLSNLSFSIEANTIFSDKIMAAYLYWALSDNANFMRELEGFLTGWKASAGPSSLYQDNALHTNLLFKYKFMEALEAFSESFFPESNANWQEPVRELNSCTQTYIQYYFDWRNFAPFPADDFLLEGEYFLMGDNRYNSIDFRHWDHHDSRIRPLYAKDAYSLLYSSYQKLFTLEESRIKGKALFSVF
ncbi:MAG: hypothetical protein KKI09_16060 [Spirochaetes bacterium]|nr:hypothetical protein [Spirochaetota bacterium]MBU0956938.1 hypothetical protein [Spirochaetota bacterium]